MRADEDTATQFPKLTGISDRISTVTQWPSQNFEMPYMTSSNNCSEIISNLEHLSTTNCPENCSFSRVQKHAGKKKRNHSLFKWLHSTTLAHHSTVAKNMKKDNLTKIIWNPHNQFNYKSDSMFQVRVFLGVYKLLQVGCIYSRQKVMQWKKLQPHCSCASANQSAPHWLPLSDNSQAANQRMKYSHLMEWSLTHPAMRKFCWLFFSIIIRISPVSPPWWFQALLTL